MHIDLDENELITMLSILEVSIDNNIICSDQIERVESIIRKANNGLKAIILHPEKHQQSEGKL